MLEKGLCFDEQVQTDGELQTVLQGEDQEDGQDGPDAPRYNDDNHPEGGENNQDGGNSQADGDDVPEDTGYTSQKAQVHPQPQAVYDDQVEGVGYDDGASLGGGQDARLEDAQDVAAQGGDNCQGQGGEPVDPVNEARAPMNGVCHSCGTSVPPEHASAAEVFTSEFGDAAGSTWRPQSPLPPHITSRTEV